MGSIDSIGQIYLIYFNVEDLLVAGYVKKEMVISYKDEPLRTSDFSCVYFKEILNKFSVFIKVKYNSAVINGDFFLVSESSKTFYRVIF